MSYLESQTSAFKSNLAASSKRGIPGQSGSRLSPASSQGPLATTNDLKRKKPPALAANEVYSQPQNTGVGDRLQTQITFAVDFLKSKEKPQTFDAIISYLSKQTESESYKRNVAHILRRHEKIQHHKPERGPETFSFRPKHNIKSPEDLLAFLQSQRTAEGMPVRELREGWPGVDDAVTKLEGEGKLLVTRNKKDNQAKMIWQNDPSLEYRIDDEFQAIWNRIKLPEPEALADELEKENLTPANKSRGLVVKQQKQQKQKRKPRRGGKTTNTHMMGVLRDYSHLKK